MTDWTKRYYARLPSPREVEGWERAPGGPGICLVTRAPGAANAFAGVHVASASPERYLRREGRLVWSSPIKGTAATPAGLTDKDRAATVMIADLVRNDLQRVGLPKDGAA